MRINFVSFQFYEHLIEIDLSSNIIENIEDKSFAAQKYLIKLDLSHNKIQDIKPKVNRISTFFYSLFLLKILKLSFQRKLFNSQNLIHNEPPETKTLIIKIYCHNLVKTMQSLSQVFIFSSHHKLFLISPLTFPGQVFVGLLRLNYLSLRANELEFIR